VSDGLSRAPRVSRRAFCQAAVLGAAGVLSSGASGGGTRGRPNILLITTDDQGPQLGCYGDPLAHTPNLDRLAMEGVQFTRAYVTHASCSPSRSSIFTGLYPHQSGQIGLAHRGYTMRAGTPTMPALLKAAGYRTGVIGKVHVAPDDALPFDWRAGIKVTDTRDVGRVADAASTFMAEAGQRPFFLMVNYFDPHRPHQDQFKGVPEKPLEPSDVAPFPFLGMDTPALRKEAAAYYNCVARIDVGMGLLLERLKKSGHANYTVVVFLGDHGPPFTRGKTTCYEAGVHIPLLIRWPGHAKPGLVSDAFISTVDLLPTVLDAVGIADVPAMAGQSLAGLLEDRNIPWRDTLCAEYTSHGLGNYFPRRSIRDDRYKLILNLLTDRPNPVLGVDGCGAWKASRDPALDGTPIRKVYDAYQRPPAVELYDLDKDPNEFENLAGRDDMTAVEKRLLAGLEAWRVETNDPLLDPEALAALTRQHDKLKAEGAKKYQAN
jgi:N-sulfoglucosamine sulfohydrolase